MQRHNHEVHHMESTRQPPTNHDLQGNAQAARYSNDITPVYLALSFCRHSMAACDHSDRMLQIKGADANQRGLGVLR